MGTSYRKLRVLMAERNISKTDLIKYAHISPDSSSKISKNIPVGIKVRNKICEYLKCHESDIMEIVPDDDKSESEK